MDEMMEIIVCKQCNKLEYYGKMRWLNGVCSCRKCYKALYERTNKQKYIWDDLDGKRPSLDDYLAQKGGNKIE